MATLSVKRGPEPVEFAADSLALGRMLSALLLLPYAGTLVITAGSNGLHKVGSKHYTGEAIDLRVHNLPDPEAVRQLLIAQLGVKFSVLRRDPGTTNDHLHLQVRKGGTYP